MRQNAGRNVGQKFLRLGYWSRYGETARGMRFAEGEIAWNACLVEWDIAWNAQSAVRRFVLWNSCGFMVSLSL